MRFFDKGQTVRSRDDKVTGVVITGNPVHCSMEGCRGVKAAVRWPDGKLTYPCSKGLASGDTTTFKLA